MSPHKGLWFEGDLFHASVAVAVVEILCQENVIAVGNVQRDALSGCLSGPCCKVMAMLS